MVRPREVTREDEALLRDVTEHVKRVDVGRVPALMAIIEPLRTLMRAHHSLCYGVGLSPDAANGVRCEFAYSQLPDTLRADIDVSFAESPVESWAKYNLRSPEPDQRNRPRAFASHELPSTGAYKLLRTLRLDTAQARVLLCDGPSLLAWIGAFRDDDYTDRELWILKQLVVPLRDRLTVERRLELERTSARTLELALEHIAAAVFVLGATGKVLHANTAARWLIAHEGNSLSARLVRAVRGEDPGFEVHATGPTHRPQYLAVHKPPPGQACARTSAASARWRLTRRQHDVFSCIVRGHSNARISAELGISERTVEVHITAILDRAQCGSRAELIAAVLNGVAGQHS